MRDDGGQSIWDPHWTPQPWSQHRSKVARTPEVLSLIKAALREVTAGAFCDLRLVTKESTSLFLEGRWEGRKALAKIHITEPELFWMSEIDRREPGLVPELFMSGERLAGVAVRWLIMERVPYHLGSTQSQGKEWQLMAEAAARFQRAVEDLDRSYAFEEGLETHLGWLRRAQAADGASEIAALIDRLEEDWAFLTAVCPPQICFGDLHFGNSLSRTPPSLTDEAVLVDPIARVQPWVFDAAYCQTIAANRDVRMPHLLAEARKALGLPAAVGDPFERAATIMLGWTAALWWGIATWRREDRAWMQQTHRYIRTASRA